MQAAFATAEFGASLFQTIGTYQETRAMAERSKQNARMGELAAKQVSGQHTQRLNRTLGTVRAMQGARLMDPDSPTSAAIRESIRRDSEFVRDIQVGNHKLQAAADWQAADAYGRQARISLITGGFKTAAKGFQAGQSIANLFAAGG